MFSVCIYYVAYIEFNLIPPIVQTGYLYKDMFQRVGWSEWSKKHAVRLIRDSGEVELEKRATDAAKYRQKYK